MPAPFSSEPIFIGGDNRSGTTLLSVILDSHPALVTGPELDFSLPANLGPEILHCCELLVSGDPRVQHEGVEAPPDLQAGVQLVKQCHRFGIEYSEMAEIVRSEMRARGSDLVSFADRCSLIEALGSFLVEKMKVSRWGIKIQRDLLRLEDFQAIWPGAQFLHIVRDGRDVAASHLFAGRHLVYTSVAMAARGWAEVIRDTRGFDRRENYFELHYEDLIRNTERVLRPLLEFLRLPWSDRVLDHSRERHRIFDHPWDHPSVEAVRKPLHQSAVGRFRRDFSKVEIAEFEAIAGPWLEAVGYPPAADGG